jgi:phosphate transport system substrate-binding protein
MSKIKIFTVLNFILGLCLLISACSSVKPTSVAETKKGTIAISGAFALYPMMTRWTEEYQKIYPDVQFDVSAGGAGKGMADALAGAVDIGMVSRAISAEEEAKGAYWVPVTKDAVFPMVSSQNPVLADLNAKGITKKTLIGIFITGEIKTWGQVVGRPEITDEIHVYTRSDACGAADVWSLYLGNKKQEDLQGIGVYGDPGLLDAVVKDPLGIGYNNLGYAFDTATDKVVEGAAAVPIDTNENGVAEAEELIETKSEAVEMVATNKYPSPPARALNLVTLNKPSGLVADFIRWILTDGQLFVGEAGFVKLTDQQLTEALAKLP